jgi:hypothetical protein
MNSNSVHRKLVEFAGEEISIQEFERMLKESRPSQKIRVQWRTKEGRRRDYWFYWDSGAYVGGSAGGSRTKELENMFNLQGDGFTGQWRTLWLDTVVRCRYGGQNYTIK